MSYNYRKHHNENKLVLYYVAVLFLVYLVVICRAVLSIVSPATTYDDIVEPLQLDVIL